MELLRKLRNGGRLTFGAKFYGNSLTTSAEKWLRQTSRLRQFLTSWSLNFMWQCRMPSIAESFQNVTVSPKAEKSLGSGEVPFESD